MDENKYDKDKGDDLFITGLTIHKVRHLQNIQIPLSNIERKHLILTGKNGSGKTSVLESLKYYLEEFDDNQRPSKFKGITVDVNSVPLIVKKSQGRLIFAYYGARRKAGMKVPKGVEKINLNKHYEIDDQPGQNFIQHIVNLKVEKSFARDDKDKETVEKIENWFEMFEKNLKEIFEDQTLRLEFDRSNYNFNIIQEGKEPFDFNTLADGYSAIINIVADLILRMEKYKKKSYDIQGIVLIDELEAHLHIDLQKKVFPFLTNFFPGIQFIVTTHSPFVLNSIENAVIYDLEKQLIVEDLSGYSYDGIVEGYFNSDKYSQVIKDKILSYEKLINREKLTEKEKEKVFELKDYLEKVPASLSPELKVRFQQIELERKKTG